ncbi:MAG: DMT family transporter [Candidatus Bathyarchaeota archaeon]|nr:DMT family transporter [Candidatus Bathyarchaeota archaeon]
MVKKGVGMGGRTRKLAVIEGATAGVLFGTAAIFIKFLPNLNAFFIVFWRLIIACIALFVITILLKKSFNLNLIRKNITQLFILSLFLALHFIFFVFALKDTTILNATVLVNTTPIFSVFISTFAFKLKPSVLAMVGLTLSLVGLCVIGYAETVTSENQFEGVSPGLKGDLEAVLAALLIALYLNYGRKIRSQTSVFTLMLPIYAFAAIAIGVLSIFITNATFTMPFEIEVILPLVGLGILPTAIAHTLYFSSLSNLKSFETATLALLEPVGATILGVALFQEIPAYQFVLGAVLVLLGIVFIVKEKG